MVVHDPRELALHPGRELALHGHTHRLTVERGAGILVFNPGECAGHMPGRNAIGIVQLTDLSVEILNF